MPTVSPAGVLVMETASVGSPLVRVIDVFSSSVMSTEATSPMVTGAPSFPRPPESREDSTGSAAILSRLSSGLPTWMGRDRVSSETVPAGTRAPLFSRASEMADGETPSEARAA
jgi:hypothetical protein